MATTERQTRGSQMGPAAAKGHLNHQQDDQSDPFQIMQEIRNAPRPRPGHTSNIVEFYRGRSVLITGASGFVGKVLIEKLLRTCPSIERVFVLIRPKFNKQPHERLRELLDSRLFDGLRDGEDSQKLEQKVVLVEGDVTEANLGLNSYDLTRVVKEVSVIFHSAATVKFDEPLKQSVAINIAGTKNMINICRRIPKLAGLVHVSTAYANCDLEAIDEHIYPVDMDPERLIEMADWLDQDTLQELKRRLLGPKPNTYTYTKSLAEWLLVRSARDLPVVICRPSIVVATASEPFKGWIDNMNGPTGVVLGAGKGLVRSMYAETEFLADLVPVDKVINLIITLGWFAHLNKMTQRTLLATRGGLDESSLSNELLTSSSACSSSAASTSGLEDSLHEEDDENENENELRPHDRSHRSTSGDRHRHCCRCHHNRHHNRHHNKHQELLNHNHHHRRHLCPADGNSSPEEECAELSSLTSESSSSEGLYSMRQDHHQAEQNQKDAKQPDEEHLIMLDDGYGSRSPHYANSIASSECSSGKSRRVRASTGQDVNNSATATTIVSTRKLTEAGSEMSTTSEIERMVMGDSDESCESNVMADGGSLEEVASKLRKLRARTVAKLTEKELAEELADIPVFHCTSGGERPITWGQVQLFILAALAVFPMSGAYRYPCAAFTNNTRLDKFYAITLHYVPAYLLDFLTKLLGGKPVLVKIFKKFDQAASVLKAFTSKQWRFDFDNRLFLMNELMNEEDRRLFDFDVSTLEWRQFCCDYVIGVRKFLMKEPMSNLAEARRQLRVVYYRNLGLQLAAVAVGAYCCASWIGFH